MGEHGPAGPPGGAGRIDDGGHVEIDPAGRRKPFVQSVRGRHHARARQRLRERRHHRRRADHGERAQGLARLGHHALQARPHDQHGRSRVADVVREAVRIGRGVDRHRDGAGRERAEPRGDPLDAVMGQDRDPVSPADAQRDELHAHRCRRRGDLGIGEPGGPRLVRDQRLRVGRAPGAPLEEMMDTVRGHGAHSTR